MKHQDFRDYCYKKNTVEHDFKMGGSNTSWLESKLKDELSYPAAINFYPVFGRGCDNRNERIDLLRQCCIQRRNF